MSELLNKALAKYESACWDYSYERKDKLPHWGPDALTRAGFASPIDIDKDLYIFERWSPFRERVDP